MDLLVGWGCAKDEGGVRGCSGVGQVIRTCQMFAHSSYQVSCLAAASHCENFSPEQIWFDSEHKGVPLNGNHPELADSGGGKKALSPRGWPTGVRSGLKVIQGHWVQTLTSSFKKQKVVTGPIDPSLNLCSPSASQ